MTEHTRVAREELAAIAAEAGLSEDLRARLASVTTPLLDHADDVATLKDYRRRLATDDLVSPVDENDPYMRGLGDAMGVVMRGWLAAYDKAEVPGETDAVLDTIADAICELGYAHRDPDPMIERDNSRGLGQMQELPGSFAGNAAGSVRVYESSAATWPHLWLNVKEPERDGRIPEATLQLRAETAWLLARQIVALVRGHYQGGDVIELILPEEGDEVLAVFDNGQVIGTVEKLTEDGELGIMATPLGNADSVFVIRKADGE